MSTTDYAVRGMTCGHCASAVTEEVSKIADETGGQVDVTACRVTVEADQQDADEAVAAADVGPGYTVVAD